MMTLFWTVICGLILTIGATSEPEHCKIYCDGPILKAVQMSGLFKDSKHFVDMPLVKDPDTTLRNFLLLKNQSDPTEIAQFLSEHFREPGDELEACHPGDFVPFPESFKQIKDPAYRQWAYELHWKWRTLCRKVNASPHASSTLLDAPSR